MNVFESIARMMSLAAVPGSDSAQMQQLADFLKIPARQLAELRLGSRYYYRPCAIAKRDGCERRILAPSPALKQMQRRLLDEYLVKLPIHDCATGFRTGLSIVDNARRHARQRLIATVDLRDFFESTRAGRVRALFTRHGWRGEALRVLMRLCVFRNSLPQGAPTSPCLSNLVNWPLDERLHDLARRSGAIYTRYGDDLAFSWRTEGFPGGFQQAVEDRLAAAGYEIQPRKSWRIASLTACPTLTGLVLAGNGVVRAPWLWRWQAWRLAWQSWWHADEQAHARLEGYRGLLHMVKASNLAHY